MARRRTATAPPASVTWRDGVHVTGTPIWCDARRRRDVCFVSAADRVGRTGHGQLIASPLTLALLGATGDGHLGVPLHRRFTLGTVRLELIAAGRPGAASLVIDLGKTVLYAGTIRTQAAHGVDGAEVRACDALVVSAPYGKPAHAFPPFAKEVERTIDHAKTELAAGRRPVFLVDSPIDGLEVATAFARANVPLAGSRPIREALSRAASVDQLSAPRVAGRPFDAPRGLQMSTPGKEPRAILWLARDRAGLARAVTDRFTTAQLSAVRDGGTDHHFAWTSAAGRKDLLAWIESANAREVFVTGACADDIAAKIDAKVIGPPTQMQLFEALS